MSKFIFPLGSECWANDALSMSRLEPYKVYKSPFNGSRVLNYMTGVMPVKLFLDSPGEFRSLYCNTNNWTIVTDGSDIQALNFKLNMRRCHLKKDNLYSFTQEVEPTINKFIEAKHTLVFILDMNDYLWFRDSELWALKSSLGPYLTRTIVCVRVANVQHLDGYSERVGAITTIFGDYQNIAPNGDAKTGYKEFFDANYDRFVAADPSPQAIR